MESLGDLSEDERELFEERAAIAEYDGGMPRPIAESEARRAVGYLRWFRSSSGQHKGDPRRKAPRTPGNTSHPRLQSP